MSAGAPIRVVIPVHDSLRWIDACLESVLAQEGVRTAVCVVDNASNDGSGEHVHGRWPDVRVLGLPQNIGYGAAINRGAKALGEGDVLALNVDTRLPSGCLRSLSDALDDDPSLGAVAPLIVGPDGRAQVAAHRFPTLGRLAAEALGLDRLPGIGARLGYHLPRLGPGRTAVDWATGVALLVRAEAWRDVGGFDPTYFFFVEEVDLQRRLRDHGWRVAVEGATTVSHHGGQRPIAPQLFAHSHEGMERFFGRRRGSAAGFAARALLCVTAATRAAGWTVIGLVSARRRVEATRWRRMFIEVIARSASRLVGR
jgi:GT2 family glycosyltransferase